MNPAGEEAGPGVRACDVFMSYARGDRPKAAALAKALDHRGLQVWWDRELGAGDLWAREIEEAVETARSVVVLWSAESVQSRWVTAEARVGLEGDRLVPVCLDDAEPPLVFREIQWRSFAGWDGEGEPPGIEELAADIEAAIQRSGEAGRKPREPARGPWPWRALAAAAVGLALGGAVVGFDLWGAALEEATDVVVGSHLLLPSFVLQAVAVGLAALYVASDRRRVWPLRAASPVRMLTWSLVLALGLGVLYDWAQQTLSPKRVLYGRIEGADRHGMRVRVQDTLGREISRSEPVDDEEGTFVLPFKPVFGDRPRRLVIEKAGCVEQKVPIVRAEWRLGRELEATFACRRDP